MFDDAIDTHYLAVRTRIKALNPARNILGMMSAQDWPPKDVFLEAFYCLVLGEVPLGKSADSASIPVVVHTLQWTWMITGTDIQTGVQLRSRGDRYRKHSQMKTELENGCYPRFAQKIQASVDATGNIIQTPIVPSESIVWTPPSFVDRNAKDSGVLYGVATVRVTDMTDMIAA